MDVNQTRKLKVSTLGEHSSPAELTPAMHVGSEWNEGNKLITRSSLLIVNLPFGNLYPQNTLRAQFNAAVCYFDHCQCVSLFQLTGRKQKISK